MVKFISLLKRRPGMSVADFKAHYESTHAVLGKQYMTEALRYERRYLTAMGHPFEGGAADAYDCLLEIWFEDEAAMGKAFARLAEPDIAAIFEEDEKKLFDRAKTLCFVINEERQLPA